MSDLAAAARILTALADAVDAADSWVPANMFVLRDAIDVLRTEDGPDEQAVAAALLAAARREVVREPRVWLPGDTVPAGVWTVTAEGRVCARRHPVPGHRGARRGGHARGPRRCGGCGAGVAGRG